MKRTLAVFLFAASLLCPTMWAQDTAAGPARSGSPRNSVDVNEIMRQAVERDLVNWHAAKDYTFLERTQEDKLDGNGRAASSKVETREIMVLYGEPFERLIARDDKPLPPREQKKQDEKFDEETRKRANETPEQRQKRIAKYDKEREENRAFVREILKAYSFRLDGEELLNGRKTWIIDGDPRPDFQPQHKDAKILPKIKPRFWIDQQDYTWARLRGEVTDTISFGLVIARLHKGTSFELQQVRLNDEIWLPQAVDVRIDARVALLKNFNQQVHVTYSDYRKFRTDSKITVAETSN